MVETHEEHPNQSICERVVKGAKVLKELDCKLNWPVTNPASIFYNYYLGCAILLRTSSETDWLWLQDSCAKELARVISAFHLENYKSLKLIR